MSDLADFVLDFCRAMDGVVEPPAYGTYDVLLPDELAAQLGVDPFQRFAFEAANAATADGVTFLAYGHSLVERMAELARQDPACARFYINAVRLDKSGLAALARSALSFPNANLVEDPRASETRALFRYVRFNFKAALLTDEKREQLVAVLMDAQTGVAVDDLSQAEAHRLDEAPVFTELPPAPAQWTAAPDPLAPQALRALLDRAAEAAVEALGAAIAPLEKRAARHLELDRARLEAYYTDLEHGLERRLKRAADDDAEHRERRAGLENKLAATRADHAAKLADVEAKYRLRVELDLVNLAVITQPKIMLAVRIENRQAGVTRQVVWDPLRHSLEPLVCEVCVRPATKLLLCANNHLVCDREGCRAPQCVDCKRVYCQHCAAELTTCVVCDRPVCQKSLNRCRACGRGTCHEHIGLCHAAQGQPKRVLAMSTAAPEAPPALEASAKRIPKKQPARRKSPSSEPEAAPAYQVMVQIEKGEPRVVAFVLDKDDQEVAQRQWFLMEWGIQVNCFCEKGWRCKWARRLLKPKSAAQIEAQLEAEIAQLCAEYHVPIYRMSIYTLQRGVPARLPKLDLGGAWKDKALLAAARAGFPAEIDKPE
jgi:hypothetical protein